MISSANTLSFIRISKEKPRGSSLTRGFIDAFGEDRIWGVRGKKHPKPEFISPEDRARIFAHHLDISLERSAMIVSSIAPQLRRVCAPLERFRSHYDFVRVRPGHSTHSRAARLPVPVIEDLKKPKAILNVLTRASTGQTHVSEDKLLKHIEGNYLIVTPSHRVNDTIRAYPTSGGGDVEIEQHRKKTADPTSEDIGDLKQWFDDANYLDVRLVQFVEANYDRWLELPKRSGKDQTQHAS